MNWPQLTLPVSHRQNKPGHLATSVDIMIVDKKVIYTGTIMHIPRNLHASRQKSKPQADAFKVIHRSRCIDADILALMGSDS